MNENNQNESEKSALQLLQDIKAGVTDPKELDKLSRQRCVELLIAEGYTYPQIGQVLKISEKTIGRDIKEIRARNELTPNVEFAKQFIGEVFQKAMSSHSFLIRLARSKDATNPEKIQAEFAAWRVLRELVEKMQSLAYLPSKPEKIVADFFHHGEEDGQDIIEVKNTLLEIEQTAKEAGTFDSKTEGQLKALRARIESAEITLDVNKLKQKQEEAVDKQEEENEK